MALKSKLTRPPFIISAKINFLVGEILRLIGRFEGISSSKPEPLLRRHNQVRTIQGSLAIEGNSLSIDHITAIFDKKPVIGLKHEIIEVQNAIEAYENTLRFNSILESDLRAAHKIFMNGLIPDAGQYRSKGVGIFGKKQIAHVAPPAKRVPHLMDQLFKFMAGDKETHPLITSSVFHYELEFIHPFSDGNGRMGRFWQHVILAQYHDIFESLPVESIIKQNQQSYYSVLGECDKLGESTKFIEFSLQTILTSLSELWDQSRPKPLNTQKRIKLAKVHFKKKTFSRKDYINLFKTLSTATASRDLKYAVESNALIKSGDKALSKYKFS